MERAEEKIVGIVAHCVPGGDNGTNKQRYKDGGLLQIRNINSVCVLLKT